MNTRNLYEVQDSDRPMYVLASSWEAALAIWRAHIREENSYKADEPIEPDGIRAVAPYDEVLT